MGWSLLVIFLALARGVYSEFHSVSFVNNCGFGTPTLLIGQTMVSNGSDFMSDMTITDALAYLDQDGCSTGDSESCMGIDINLSNDSPSFVDISLVPPQTYQSAACVAYSNGCDGASLSCTEPNCLGALTSDEDSLGTGTILMCEEEDVNIVITFCDCDTPPVSSSIPGVIVTSWTSVFVPSTSSGTSSSSTVMSLPSSTEAHGGALGQTSWMTTSSISTTLTPTSTFASTVEIPLSTSTPLPSVHSTSSVATTTSQISIMNSQSTSAATSTFPLSGPSTSNPETSSVEGASRKSRDRTAVVGGVLGGILATLIIVIAIFFFIRQRRRVRSPGRSNQRGLDPFTGENEPPTIEAYGSQGARAMTYAPISSAASPVVHSPQPRRASSSSVMDIRSTSNSEHTRIAESSAARASTISSDNPFNLPPLANLSSFSLLSPPGEEGEISSVGSPLGQRFLVTDPFDPFADAQAVDDPPPSYKG